MSAETRSLVMQNPLNAPQAGPHASATNEADADGEQAVGAELQHHLRRDDA